MHKKFFGFVLFFLFLVQGSYAGCENYLKKHESAMFSFHAFSKRASNTLLCYFFPGFVVCLFDELS